jgi:predicted nucleic acid-binding protein
VIFDSDVLIWFYRGDENAKELIDATADRATSIVSVMELLQGARSKAEMKTTQEFIRNAGLRVIPLNEQIGHLAAAFIEEHALSGGLRIEDALIAATARDSGEVLATANVRHFRPIRNLQLKAFRPARHSAS